MLSIQSITSIDLESEFNEILSLHAGEEYEETVETLSCKGYWFGSRG